MYIYRMYIYIYICSQSERGTVGVEMAGSILAKTLKIENSNFTFEHIELRAKILDYFLRSNKSNINQLYVCIYIHVYIYIYMYV